MTSGKVVLMRLPWRLWVSASSFLMSCLDFTLLFPDILTLSSCSPAEMCIEKSLLLFRFAPCGVPCQGSDASKATESSSALLFQSSSISEGDFQASSSLGPQAAGCEESCESRCGQSQSSSTHIPNSSSCGHSRRTHRDSTESLSPQPGEPASPSAYNRKAPFSRARLRLLSCRSIEEPRMTPSVKDRYPILKHILNFIKDQALTTAR